MLQIVKNLAIYYYFKFYLVPKNRNRKVIPSSTILFLREGDEANKDDGERGGVEVFMVVRHHQIDFASGAFVFPGGKVDKGDMTPNVRQRCDGVDGMDDSAIGFRVAAIREGFEECGLLLARAEGETQLLSAERVRELDHYREPLNNHEITLESFLVKEKLRLACDHLTLYSQWITPEYLPKRFDTFFYVAKAPQGQYAIHDGYESVDSEWITAKKALELANDGTRTIIFPTRLNLQQLSKYNSIDDVFQQVAAQDTPPVLPTLIRRGLNIYVHVPKEIGYDDAKELYSEEL